MTSIIGSAQSDKNSWFPTYSTLTDWPARQRDENHILYMYRFFSIDPFVWGWLLFTSLHLTNGSFSIRIAALSVLMAPLPGSA
ncbi:hypothetical protein XELAEV_18045495mg [Xenopus laevis]|uniref:Uncharacterized protein n=1 Tax=Xenopus laevis TaxID=8355 RepID=A0A974C0X4_XENLA|nr:hypothetical protein XELAEV_18045495mg [Xenopus laevis]